MRIVQPTLKVRVNFLYGQNDLKIITKTKRLIKCFCKKMTKRERKEEEKEVIEKSIN